jgi:hypothetical protein
MQPEPANIQINDGGDYGRLAGGENPEELIQPYPDSADNSAQCIYDYYDSDNEEGEYTPQFTAGHFIPIQERLANSSNAATFATQTSGIVNSSIYDANVSALIDQSVELNKDLLQAVTQKVIKTENDIKTFTISTSGLKDKLQYTMKPGHFDLFNLDGGTV